MNPSNSPNPLGEDPFETTVTELANLTPLAYDKVRVEKAKALGVRVTTLDAEVVAKRPLPPRSSEDCDGLEVPEPWSYPVNGAELAGGIAESFLAHIVFNNPLQADALAVWVMGTFLMDRWSLWPKVLITSPEKRCGKTTLLEAIEGFALKGLLVTNISVSALFRSIEAWQPTLLIDEADRFISDNPEIHGIINAGHRRRSAFVMRSEERKGELKPRRFSVWASQAIAGIGAQADTLADRALRIRLRRRLPSEMVSRLPVDFYERHVETRRRIARWAMDNGTRVASIDICPANLGNDRAQDNWMPLFSIAQALGNDWLARIDAAYRAIEISTAEDPDDSSAGVRLLHDVTELLQSRRGHKIGSSDLCRALVALEDAPWANWRRGDPISARGVAMLLKPYGIRPSRDHQGSVYSLTDFQDAIERYAAAASGIAVTSATNATVTSTAAKKGNENGY